jgi:hypothetical protein
MRARLFDVWAALATLLVTFAKLSSADEANTTAPNDDGLQAQLVDTGADGSIERIPLTIIFASIVGVVAIANALLDRCFPPEAVTPRTFTPSEQEAKALAPPKVRYANLMKPGQVAVPIQAAPAPQLVAPTRAAAVAPAPSAKKAPVKRHDPLLDALLDDGPRGAAATTTTAPKAQPVFTGAKPRAPVASPGKKSDPFADLDIL